MNNTFKNALQTDMKRATKSWGFYVSAIGFFICIFVGGLEQILQVLQNKEMQVLPTNFCIELLLTALSSDTVLFIMPVLCALPFTAAFLDDYTSGYIWLYLPRSTEKSYTKARVWTTAISGGLSPVLGFSVAAAMVMLFLYPMEMTPVAEQMAEGSAVSQVYFVDFIGRLLLFFVNGSFWSLVGGLSATLTQSKYMAYAAPFIFYYFLIILCERYLPTLYVLHPHQWVAPQTYWNFGQAALLVVGITIFMGLLYSSVMRRRIAYA